MKIAEHKKAHVLKQIDFYFSDSNLPFDKFLKGECQAEGGWVDLSVVIAFARVQNLLGKEWKGPDAVTDDAIQLVSGIMQDSNIVEVSGDQYQIRRKDHGAVNQVRLLKYADMGGTGCFRGCALVEMSSIEEASMILSNSMEYEGSVLRVQSKADYEEAMAKVRTESKDTHTADVWRTVVTADGLPPDPPSAKEDDGTGQAPNVKHEGEVGETADAKQNEDDPPAAQVKQHILTDYEKDQLVRFDVVGDDDGLPAGRDLRDALGGQTKGIRFVDHPMGTKSGVIRCKDTEHASALMKAGDNSGELEISSGHKLKLTMITGDEEAAVWTKIHAAAAGRTGKRPARGRGGGGRHAKRGRR